ncbi:MAG: hypothetical protein HY652_08150 [Acidobacteria bacterium]|nr:hypothetical protein [Acidobacteriota bacterium]
MARLRFRRKKLLINPSFQLRSALLSLIFLLFCTFLLGFLIFFPLQRELATYAGVEEQAVISRQILMLHKRVWPGVALVFFLVGFFFVVNSHRTAGPVYRVGQTLEALIGGNFQVRMKLRKGDRFLELEEIVNRLAAELETADQKRRLELTELRQRLAALRQSLTRNGASLHDCQSSLDHLLRDLETQTTSKLLS